MLPADVYFMRMEGEEVLFPARPTNTVRRPRSPRSRRAWMCASTAAYAPNQKDIYRRFGLSFDYFRLLIEKNTDCAAYTETDENGYRRRTVNQVCSAMTYFLPDRYVIDVLEVRVYLGERINAIGVRLSWIGDLQNPRSAISGSTNLEIRQTKHLFPH